MQAFITHQGIVAPLDRANVDTDAIIPKQFLKSIKRKGYGENLFDAWRYLDEGQPDTNCAERPLNLDFILNQSRYRGASILLTRENFGCGSSREHAVWALADYGFRVLIAPSFADIFYNNCFKNGLLPIVLTKNIIQRLFDEVSALPNYQLNIDLPQQKLRSRNNTEFDFVIDASRKHCLLSGLDEIGLSLQHADEIRAFEARHRAKNPWLFA